MTTDTAPIVLVPGFWLGAWAWDDVAQRLRDRGHVVTALTLPGLEPDHGDPGAVTLADHTDAIADAVRQAADDADRTAVLAVHSGAGIPGYGATGVVHDRLAHVLYVDSAPGTGALNPDFADDAWPLPSWQWLEDDGSSLEGLTDEQLTRFRDRAVPQPAATLREAPDLGDDARRGVPSTVLCTAFPSSAIKDAVAEGYAWLGGLAELEDVTYVDLPTSHWPMWSRPEEVAELLDDLARGVSPRQRQG